MVKKILFMMRTFEIYSHSSFQTYNTVLLTKVTMAPGPVTSWQIHGETVETVTDFILGAPKSLLMVTTDMKLKDTCSLE